MFGIAFHGCCQSQEFDFVTVGSSPHRGVAGDAGFALGEGSGFIEDDRIQFVRQFQTIPPFNQNAVFRPFPRSHHNRGGGCQTQGAGTGDNQHPNRRHHR